MARVFEAPLFEWDGPAAWHFIAVPLDVAPDFAGAFGRVPVTATVDGVTWSTSVWREKDGRWLMPVPKRIRGAKGDGDVVAASLDIDVTRL